MKPKVIITWFAPAFCFLLFWEFLIYVRPDFNFFLGSPTGVWLELLSALSNSLLYDIGVTATEALTGFVAGTVVGTTLGLLLWLSPTIFHMMKPYVIAVGAIPVFALGPVVVFWFGTGMSSKIFIAFLSTVMIAFIHAYEGAVNVDPNLLRVMHALRSSKWTIYRKIIIPSASLWMLAGIRLNISMALLGAFIGEFIASRAGLGHFIIVAEGLYNVNQIWVGILGLMFLALVFHAATKPIETWANMWKQ